MSVRRRRRRNEKGTVLPLVALSLVVLMGFAAFAVDAGNGYAERRRSQSTADASVLAAAVETLGSGFTTQDLLDRALAFAENNLPTPPLEEDWRDCQDPDAVALGYIRASDFVPPLTLDNHFGTINGYTTDCFSISGGGDTIRVQLPDRDIDTYFAPVIGVDTLTVQAFAEASIVFPGVAKAPPFVVTAGTDGGNEECLRISSGSQLSPQWNNNGIGVPATPGVTGVDPPDPCDEIAFPTASSTFGTLDPYFYEDVNPGPPDQQCQNPGSNSIDHTIAEGIDHLLGAYDPDYTPGDPELVEGNGCPGNPPQLFPNTMATQTGYSAQRLANGLLYGGTFDGGPFTGRLTKTPNPLSVRFAGEPMDNTPLWAYIRPDVNTASVPASCRNTFNAIGNPLWDFYDLKAEMISCIQNHTPAHDYVLTEDILLNGRFAFIPLVAEGTIPMGVVHFNEFVPIYINKLYQQGIQGPFTAPDCWEQDASVPGNTGWHTHEAGQPFDCGRPNQNVDRVASLVLECRMLPDTVCIDNNPGTPGGDPVLTIELTK